MKKPILAVSLLIVVFIAIGMTKTAARTHYNALLEPNELRVTCFTIEHPALRPGETTKLRASAVNTDHPPLTYTWTAAGGSIQAEEPLTAIWTAPANEGHYQVKIEVTDAIGHKTSGTAGILVARHPSTLAPMSVDPACIVAK